MSNPIHMSHYEAQHAVALIEAPPRGPRSCPGGVPPQPEALRSCLHVRRTLPRQLAALNPKLGGEGTGILTLTVRPEQAEVLRRLPRSLGPSLHPLETLEEKDQWGQRKQCRGAHFLPLFLLVSSPIVCQLILFWRCLSPMKIEFHCLQKQHTPLFLTGGERGDSVACVTLQSQVASTQTSPPRAPPSLHR